MRNRKLVLCEVDERANQSLLYPYRPVRGVNYVVIDDDTTPESLVQELRDREFIRFKNLSEQRVKLMAEQGRYATSIDKSAREIDKLDAALSMLKGDTYEQK